jgi:hypothetical protein
VAAQPAVVSPELEKQYDAAFQEMLRKPADLDVLFKFAALASQTGDLEGSISALERMLLINPDLPRVRLELGVLYYRLGSYEVARTYLAGVLKSQSLPPDVRGKAEQFMAEIESKQSPSHFSGEVFFGWRYQSNANFGPTTSSVRLFGQTANLNTSSVGQPDWGIVGSATIRHVYDLGLQDKAAIESQFTAYSSRQFQLTTANVALLDFVTGPRFQIFSGTFEDMNLRPFITAGQIWINDTSYYGSYGGGLEYAVLLGDRLRNNTIFSWRRHNHPDTWYLPNNSTFRGTEYSGTTTFQYQLSPLVGLFALGSAQRYETDVTPQQNYQLWGAGVGMQIRFPDPIFSTTLPWTLTLAVSQQWWRYDVPDVQVDPTQLRLQNDSIVNLTAAIPFDDRTTLTITGGRFVRSSDIPNYAFVNNSAMFGVTWRF